MIAAHSIHHTSYGETIYCYVGKHSATSKQLKSVNRIKRSRIGRQYLLFNCWQLTIGVHSPIGWPGVRTAVFAIPVSLFSTSKVRIVDADILASSQFRSVHQHLLESFAETEILVHFSFSESRKRKLNTRNCLSPQKYRIWQVLLVSKHQPYYFNVDACICFGVFCD